MAAASGFTWFHLIPAVDHDTLVPGVPYDSVLVHTLMVCAVLIAFAVLGRMGLEAAKRRPGLEAYMPDDRLTPRTVAELVADLIGSITTGMLSKKDAKLFFPLICALFVYIFSCNILTIVPGFSPPTDNISTNVGMALIVFLTFNVVGIARDPVGYFKHLWGPVPLLGLLLFPIEVFSLCLRPLTLSFRLAVNLFADHLVYGIANDMVFILAFPLMFLAILVSAVQAFVFSLLSVVYLHLALPHHHDDHEEHAEGGPSHAHAH
jgi:F-type H+-transporting ATPase subunit a